jgi:Bromodomain
MDVENGELKPQTVLIKVPSTPSQGAAKKRKGQDNYDDYMDADTTKSTYKRRSSPLVELSSIFEEIISHLISKPEAFEFCNPVSQHAVKDYYAIIRRPMWLEQIREVLNSNLEYSQLPIQYPKRVPERCATGR